MSSVARATRAVLAVTVIAFLPVVEAHPKIFWGQSQSGVLSAAFSSLSKRFSFLFSYSKIIISAVQQCAPCTRTSFRVHANADVSICSLRFEMFALKTYTICFWMAFKSFCSFRTSCERAARRPQPMLRPCILRRRRQQDHHDQAHPRWRRLHRERH